MKKGHAYSANPEDYLQLCCSCHRKYDFTEDIRAKMKAKKFGERHNSAKLSNKEVLEIKDLILSGMRNDDISERFNVTPTTISNIKTGKRWNYLTNIKQPNIQ